MTSPLSSVGRVLEVGMALAVIALLLHTTRRLRVTDPIPADAEPLFEHQIKWGTLQHALATNAHHTDPHRLMTTNAAEPNAQVPSGCTTAMVVGAPIGGVCSYLTEANAPACCMNSSLPDISLTCPPTNGAARDCGVRFMQYWCSVSCTTAGTAFCLDEYKALASACASCPALASLVPRPGAVGDFVAAANLSTSAAVGSCAPFVVAQQDSAVPVIVRFTTNTSSITVPGVATVAFDLAVTAASAPFATQLRWFAGNEFAVMETNIAQRDFTWNGSASTWTASAITSLDTNLIPNGVLTVIAQATTSGGPSAPLSLPIVLNVSAAPTFGELQNICAGGASGSGTAFVPSGVGAARTFVCNCATGCRIVATRAAQPFVLAAFVLMTPLTMLQDLHLEVSGDLTVEDGAESLRLTRCRVVVASGGRFIVNKALTIDGSPDSVVHFAPRSVVQFLERVVLQLVVEALTVVEVRNTTMLSAGGQLLLPNASGSLELTGMASRFVVAGNTTADNVDMLVVASGGAVRGDGVLVLQRGRVRFDRAIVQVWLALSTLAAVMGRRVALTDPAFVASYATSCGSTIGSGSVTVSSQTALVILGNCTYSGSVIDSSGQTLNVASVTGGNTSLTVASGGYLVFDQVSVASGLLNIDGPLIMQQGSNLEVDSAGSAFPQANATIALARFQAVNGSCDAKAALATVTFSGCPTNATCSVETTSELSSQQVATFCRLNLLVRGLPSPFVFTDAVFNLTLTTDCAAFSAVDFVATIVRVLAATRLMVIPAERIRVLSASCGSTLAQFQCGGVTVGDAVGLCQTIVNDANTPGSPMNTALGVVNPSSGGSSSNKGLYGLFALFALPLLVCLVCVLCVRFVAHEASEKSTHNVDVEFSDFGDRRMGMYPETTPVGVDPDDLIM